MKKSSSKGFKLTTVFFAVIILALSAALTNTSVANNFNVVLEADQN